MVRANARELGKGMASTTASLLEIQRAHSQLRERLEMIIAMARAKEEARRDGLEIIVEEQKALNKPKFRR